jgi:hypothetical protein
MVYTQIASFHARPDSAFQRVRVQRIQRGLGQDIVNVRDGGVGGSVRTVDTRKVGRAPTQYAWHRQDSGVVGRW